MSHVDDGTLHAYLDGELSAMEAVKLERHMSDCPACRERLEEQHTVVRRAGQLLELVTPPLAERAAPASPQPRISQLWWRLRTPLAWAASTVLVVAVGWYVRGGLVQRESRESAPRPAGHTTVAPTPVSPTPPTPSAPAESKELVAAGIRADRPAPALAAESSTADRARAPIPTREIVTARPRITPAEPAAPSVPSAALAAPTPSAGLQAAAVRVDSAGHQPPPAIDEVAAKRVARREETDAWPEIGFDVAGRLLGQPPLAIPGLHIRRMARSPSGDPVVMVEQAVDSGTVVRLYERQVAFDTVTAARNALLFDADSDAAAARDRAAPGAAALRSRDRFVRDVGPVRVEIAGPLPVDSLRKLLELAK